MRQTNIILSCLFGSLLVWACSSGDPSTPTTTTKDPVTGKDSPDSKDAPSASPSAGPTGSPTGGDQPAAGGAKTEAQLDACYEACGTKNPNHAKYDELETAATACKCAPTTCGTQCGQTSECKDEADDEKEGDACAQCIEGAAATQCETTFATACNADPSCKVISDCYNACDPEEGDDDDKSAPGK